MPRIKKKKKPLRGSIRQNTADESRDWLRFFGFWPRLALLVLGSVALIVFVGWLWRGQWPRQQQALLKKTTLEITQQLGFSVKDVLVEGRNYTDKKTLLNALDIKAGEPIFTFNPYKAHANVLNLPWTKSATILRSLPNKIIIRLVERKPIARWQHKDRTIVIDAEGKELLAAKIEQFPTLPLIIGNVVPAQTEALLSLLAKFPLVSQRLKAAVRVAERRWNLHLYPNIIIRLPETNMHNAMIRLEELIENQKIVERGIKAIDLRLPEKIFIEPETPQAEQPSGEQK